MLRVLYSSSMADAGTISYLKAIDKKIEDVEKVDLDGKDKQELVALLEELFRSDNIKKTLALQPLKDYQTELTDLYLKLNKEYDVEGATDYSELRTTMTAEAIIRELGDVQGKTVAIVNRSGILGKPIALKLMELGATVAVFNSHSPKKSIAAALEYSDIIILAAGKNFLDSLRLGYPIVFSDLEEYEKDLYYTWDTFETKVIDLSNDCNYKKAIRHIKTVDILKERL